MKSLQCAWALLVAQWIVFPSVSASFQKFDFDQTYLTQPGFILKDHTLLRAPDGTYHIFYIQGDLSLPVNQHAKSLGHATSTDLEHWTYHPNVIDVVDNTWEEAFIWAPYIVQRNVGAASDPLYYMFYTGVNWSYAQATGVAVSTDLFNWTKAPNNPVYIPDTSWAAWSDSTWSNCRDPHVFRDSGTWYMLNTAWTNNSEGAIALATSTDLLNWQDAGPLMVHPGPNAWHVLESVSMHNVNGAQHLFFTEENVGGTSYLQADDVLGPWNYAEVDSFDAGHASEFRRIQGQWFFSRHQAFTFLGEPFYAIRIDNLAWETASKPVVNLAGPLDNWISFGGTAFDGQPTFWDNTLQRGLAPANFGGNSWIGTAEAFGGPLNYGESGETVGDAPIGVLRSPTFKLEGNRISFRIGGGYNPNGLYVALYSATDAALQFKATGTPNFLETMAHRVWDVSELVGDDVYILIADLDTQGHLNVDEICEYFDPNPATDAPQPRHGLALLPNAPNPFNPTTWITADLPATGRVRLEIFDARGRIVRSLLNREMGAGRQRVLWDGNDDHGRGAASGVYYVRLRFGTAPALQRAMVLIK